MTPCWVHGAVTAADLDRVHWWHVLRGWQLRDMTTEMDDALRGTCQALRDALESDR